MNEEMTRNPVAEYTKMYAILCGGISDALDCLPFTPATEETRRILEDALEEAEEVYLQG